MIKNILLTIEYNGKDFAGWQIQPESRTVQGEVERAVSKMAGAPTKVEGTSRTDAGVHAHNQKATIRGDFGIPTEKIPMVLNRLLPGDIKIKAAEEKEEGFHARFSCKGKQYVYRIMNTGEKDVFAAGTYCFIESRLDEKLMNEGAKAFIGTHDFKAFMAMGSTPQKTTIRTIYDASVVRSGDLVEFFVTGDGFLYNMVRIMAGTLMEVGSGKREPKEIEQIITGKDRAEAGRTAPPEGLYLNEVYFEARAYDQR